MAIRKHFVFKVEVLYLREYEAIISAVATALG